MNPSYRVKKALVIIDMQNGLYFAEPAAYMKEHVLKNINFLIREFRRRNEPVIFVQHTGPKDSPIEQGKAAWQLVSEMESNPATDLIFSKFKASIFTETPLLEWLTHRGITDLCIAGMKTQYCVDTACRAASGFGFNVVLASDAHTCMDTPALTAQQIINHHNMTLSGPFARVNSTAEIVGTDIA